MFLLLNRIKDENKQDLENIFKYFYNKKSIYSIKSLIGMLLIVFIFVFWVK